MSRWYFFSFYVCCVMIVNNLVVGLIIDSFMGELEESAQEIEEEKTLVFDRKFGEERLLFKLDMLPGERKGSGTYVAKLNDKSPNGQKYKILNELLPQKETVDVEKQTNTEGKQGKMYDLGS